MDSTKLIAFDVDGTLTEGNIWQRTHAIAGITTEEDSKYFLLYYEGKITFKQWADFIIEKYRRSARTRKEFESCAQSILFVSGAKEVVFRLKKRYKVCLVSSGIDFYVRRVAKTLLIDEYYANYSFQYDSNGVIKNIIYDAPEDRAKVIVLKSICQKRLLKPEQIIFVGDSSNDREAFLYTKRGILVGKGNEELKKASWMWINSLKEIESILS